MEKKRKVIQVYAIIVNIVVIVTFIISVTSLVSALIDRNAPLYAGYNQEDLSSFEKYKLEVLRSTKKDDAYIPTDETIREMFEAARQERINKAMHRTFRDLMVSSVVIAICFILFGFHWWLFRRYDNG
jgi:ABC-type transport system involved in multi-copper enzyme maturation permease subunit